MIWFDYNIEGNLVKSLVVSLHLKIIIVMSKVAVNKKENSGEVLKVIAK